MLKDDKDRLLAFAKAHIYSSRLNYVASLLNVLNRSSNNKLNALIDKELCELLTQYESTYEIKEDVYQMDDVEVKDVVWDSSPILPSKHLTDNAIRLD